MMKIITYTAENVRYWHRADTSEYARMWRIPPARN